MAQDKLTSQGRPTVTAALRRVAQEAKDEDLDVSRISIRLLASGEVTYRLHPADGSEYQGGVISVA